MKPYVAKVTKYVQSNFGDIFKANGPSDPFRPVYPLIYPKWFKWGAHARKTLWEAAYAHDAGYWMLSLPGSPYHAVTRQEWDLMYYEYIKCQGHPVVARIQYTGLQIGGSHAWDKNQAWMWRLGYTDLPTWACMKRSSVVSGDPH